MSADEPVFEKTYLISVEAPMRLGMEDLGKLVDVVADAAYAWAETHKGRDWDLFIGGLPKDDATHSAEAAFERVNDENERLRDLLCKITTSQDLDDEEATLLYRAVASAKRRRGESDV